MSEALVNPTTGTTQIVDDPREAERLRSSGWTAASAEQAQAMQLQAEHGGLAGTATAFGAGALRGATLGASDYALSALGGGETQEYLRTLRQVNPGASMAGELAGDVASMAIPIPGAGAGALARGVAGGARALSAPARMLARGAETAGEFAARRLGGGAASSMARWGVRGAVEGAGFGVQQTLTEDALGERELTGEGLLASVGWGAATGGVMGSAIAGTGAIVRGGLNKLAAAKGGGIGGAVAELYGRAVGAAGIENASFVKRAAGVGDDATEIRRILSTGREELDELSRRFVGLADDMEQPLSNWERAFKGGQKAGHIRRNINPAYADEALTQSRGTLAAVVSELDEMAADTATYARTGDLKKVRDTARKALAELDKPGADATKAFMALDKVKRDIAKRGMGKKLLGAVSDELTVTQQATKARLKKGYLGLQDILERRDWWGNAAKAQQDINSAWSKLIPEEADRGAMRRLYDKRDVGPFEKRRTLNRDSLARALEDPTSREGAQVMKAMRSRLENGAEFMRQAEKHLGSGDAAAYMERLGDAQKTLDRMEHIRNVLGEFDAIGQSSGIGGMALAAMGGGALGAGVIDPEVGGAIGLMATAVLDPKRTIRQLAAAERLAGKAAERMRSMTGKAVGRNVVRQSTRATTGFSAWQDRERNKAERAAELTAKADPVQVEQQATMRLGALGQGAPEAVAAAGRAAARGALYLQANAPRPMAELTSIQPLRTRAPDDAMNEWNARRKAVDRPASLLMDVADGRNPHPAAIEAVRSVYPELYQRQIVEPLLDGVAEQAARGNAIDYDAAAVIANVTGQAISPLDAPEISDAIARALGGAGPQPEQQPAPPQGGDDGQARVERAQTEYQRVMA